MAESGKILPVGLEYGKNLPVKFGNLFSGIWNTAQGIRNPTNDYN